MADDIVKVNCSLGKVFFPKNSNKIDSGEYGIFIANINKVYDDSIQYKDKSIKLRGKCPLIEYGSNYKIYSKLAEKSEKYGDTYEILYASKVIDISTKNKQIEYLKHFITGRTIENLFSEYDDVISLLEKGDLESLIKVKGIGKHTAERIINDYNSTKDYSRVYVELGELGFSDGIIKRLVDTFKSPDIVIDKVRNEPYELVKVQGFAFKSADEIALKVGVDRSSWKRVKAFLHWFMNEQGEAGKSWLSYTEIMSAIYDTLGFVPEPVISSAAKFMIDNGEIIVLDNGNKIALKKYYNLEQNIKIELNRLLNGTDDCYDIRYCKPLCCDISDVYFNKRISELQFQQGFEFTEEQINAIKLGLKSNVLCVTGGAGVGKTSVAKGCIGIYPSYSKVACVALSGKAAQRIYEATGIESSTIHKMLGINRDIEDKHYFDHNETNPLDADIVLIDEATMINGSLFLDLLKAIRTNAKVIIMGDVQQLTPLGNCQVFADILHSEVIPSIKLTKLHRQAQASGIIPTSIKVASQQQIFNKEFEGNEILGDLKDMELDISSNIDNLSNKILDYFKKELNKFKDIMEVQVCVAMKSRGNICTYQINKLVQNYYNPKTPETKFYDMKYSNNNYELRVGDKVINRKNNYNALVFTENMLDESFDYDTADDTAIFNGNIGIVKDIIYDSNGKFVGMIIDFIGIGNIFLKSLEEIRAIELAYACTCHSLQGSGFMSVIVGIDNSSYVMNNSELLYTALTRAKKYCVLVGNNTAVRNCISRKEVNNKQTFLKELLKEENNNEC